MRGLSKRIQAMVRRKTGIKIPTVMRTYMVPLRGRSVRVRSQTSGTANTSATKTVPEANKSVLSKTL